MVALGLLVRANGVAFALVEARDLGKIGHVSVPASAVR
jgi:hypothetical protein